MIAQRVNTANDNKYESVRTHTVALKAKHFSIFDAIITQAHIVIILSLHFDFDFGWIDISPFVAFKNIAAVLMV